MPTEDEIPDDVLEHMSLLIEVVKAYLKWVAICVPLLTILIASPLLKRSRVKLTPQNPMYVVDAHQFGQALLDETARSNVSSAVVEKLNRSLGAKLGETGGKFVFFREWYHQIVPFKYPARESITNVAEFGLRGALSQRKGWLGYDDADARFQFGIVYSQGDNIHTVDELLRNPSLLELEICDRYDWRGRTNRFGNSAITYWHDPFYSVVESLSTEQKLIVYSHLADASQSYSAFIIENQGPYDEYDVRITANVSPTDVDSNTLNSYSVLIDQVVRDSVRFRIPNLAPGPLNYKMLIIGRGGGSNPVRADAVRLDEKSFVEQVTDRYRWFLFLPAIFTFSDVGIAMLKRKRKQNSEDLVQI